MTIAKMLLVSVVIILCRTSAARVQEKNAVQDELKSLQGVWQVTQWIDPEGMPATDDEVKGASFEFKKDQMIKRDGGRAREPLKVILDPAKKPKWIDFDIGFATGVEMKGIYKLEGDALTLCIISGSTSGQPAERPTEFKANKQKHHTLFVMKKAKK